MSKNVTTRQILYEFWNRASYQSICRASNTPLIYILLLVFLSLATSVLYCCIYLDITLIQSFILTLSLGLITTIFLYPIGKDRERKIREKFLLPDDFEGDPILYIQFEKTQNILIQFRMFSFTKIDQLIRNLSERRSQSLSSFNKLEQLFAALIVTSFSSIWNFESSAANIEKIGILIQVCSIYLLLRKEIMFIFLDRKEDSFLIVLRELILFCDD